jgi:hypothetical protein
MKPSSTATGLIKPPRTREEPKNETAKRSRTPRKERKTATCRKRDKTNGEVNRQEAKNAKEGEKD